MKSICLPEQITVGSKGTITYLYDAAGAKWQKTTVDNVHGITTVTTYVSGLEYRRSFPTAGGGQEGDTLQFFGNGEGRYRLVTPPSQGGAGGGYLVTDYFLLDHLGNTRMVLTDDIAQADYPVLQETHYYPFGLTMAGISFNRGDSPNRYLFNGGTELNGDFDIDLYETPNRGYDAQIGRFHQVDGLADSYSGITPYQFGFDNPVSFNDPTGLDPERGSLEYWKDIWFNKPVGYNDGAATFEESANAHSSFFEWQNEMLDRSEQQGNLQKWSNLLTGLSVAYALGIDISYNVNNVIVSPLENVPEDLINVNSKDKTVTVTKTDSPYDVIMVNDGDPFTRSKEDSKKLLDFYQRVGYSIRNPKAMGTTLSDAASAGFLGGEIGVWIRGLISLLRKSDSDDGGKNLTIRSDIVLSGGRSGQLVKTLEGPANSVLKGGQGRVFITDDVGKVIWDITKDRAKSVIPGQGFGSKVAPTNEQLNLLKQVWGN